MLKRSKANHAVGGAISPLPQGSSHKERPEPEGGLAQQAQDEQVGPELGCLTVNRMIIRPAINQLICEPCECEETRAPYQGSGPHIHGNKCPVALMAKGSALCISTLPIIKEDGQENKIRTGNNNIDKHTWDEEILVLGLVRAEIRTAVTAPSGTGHPPIRSFCFIWT